MEEMKWYPTPDGITNGEKEIKCTDERAFPFYVTHYYGVLCGESGSYHARPFKDDDTLALAVQKVIRLKQEVPDYLNDYFQDVEFDESESNFERTKKCANAIVKDIYCDGRCFDLTNEYGQVVFMFWKAIGASMQVQTIHSVCAEKGLDDNTAVVAKDTYDQSPDTIFVNGKAYNYRHKRAFPFIVFESPKDPTGFVIKFGMPSSFHTLLTASIINDISKQLEKQQNLKREEARAKAKAFVDKFGITEGRFWILLEEEDKIIFSFWDDYKRYDKAAVIKKICDLQQLDYDKAYVTMFGKIIKADLIQQVLSFKPSDEDYANNPYNDDAAEEENERLRRMRAIHLMGQEEKREALADFRRDKVAAYDDKHLKYEKPRDGYPYMTDAEYRFRTSMDEKKNKPKKKTLILSEKQIDDFKKNKTIYN